MSRFARPAMVLGLAALVASANASPATAFDTAQLGQGGSLAMSDILPLIEQSSELKREVMEASARIGKKPDEIVCGGMRFSNQWEHLGAFRVAPYICAFGEDRFLEIRATVRITSRSGKAFEKVTREAMKNASRIRETKPTWQWLSEDPRLKQRQ